MHIRHVVAAAIAALCPWPALAGPACADLVLVDADIRTLDDALPRARALATIGARIVAIGDEAAVRPLACDATRVVDAGGRLVLPGFNDSHVHFMDGGQALSSVDLRDAGSQAAFARRIATFVAGLPAGQWVLNGNWDHERWTPNDLPTRALIDAVTPDHPVFVQRLDGHMGLANSRALALAGIAASAPQPTTSFSPSPSAPACPSGLTYLSGSCSCRWRWRSASRCARSPLGPASRGRLKWVCGLACSLGF